MEAAENSPLPRNKLIAQNQNLHSQIAAMCRRTKQVFGETKLPEEQISPETLELTKHIQKQMVYMKQLRKRIALAKETFSPLEMDNCRREEDSLAILKGELGNYAIQRRDVAQTREAKAQALEFNQPLGSIAGEIFSRLSKTKMENSKLKNLITNLEREIRQNHQVKQMAKTAINVTTPIVNPESQLSLLSSLTVMAKEGFKSIEQKWKPQISSLDSLFFQLKDILKNKKLQLQVIQKQDKVLGLKVASMRDQEAMRRDRERLDNLRVAGNRRIEMQVLIEEELRKKEVRAVQNPSQSEPLAVEVALSGLAERLKNDVGVGTSFYFPEDE